MIISFGIIEEQVRKYITEFANKYQENNNKAFPVHESKIREAIQEILFDDFYETYDENYYAKKYSDIPRECITEICTKSTQYRNYRDNFQIKKRNKNIIKLMKSWLEKNQDNNKYLVILAGASHFDILSDKAATKPLKEYLESNNQINFTLFFPHKFREICLLKQQQQDLSQPQKAPSNIAPHSSFHQPTAIQESESKENHKPGGSRYEFADQAESSDFI